MRLVLAALCSAVVIAAVAGLAPAPARARVAPACAGPGDSPLVEIRRLRLTGELDAALRRGSDALVCDGLEATERVRLLLELARVHDRFGLHYNSRPVLAAADSIARAARVAESAGRILGGEIEFARAYDRYRAESPGSGFPEARRHVAAAIETFENSGDHHRHADAVHLLGLVEMRSDELDRAMELFELSRALDERGGSREFFLGDYHRHVALVERARGDGESALTHFEQSYAYRRGIEATDAGLFAAVSLGSQLVELGRAAEARDPLIHALVVAMHLRSPRGTAEAAGALGRMLEALGDVSGAIVAQELSAERARAVRLSSMESRSLEALRRLRGASSSADRK